jgi:hypothetical protein
VTEVGVERLGVGLEVLDTSTNEPMTAEKLASRIQQIESYNCNEIDVWVEPLPQYWWDQLRDWVHS